jgi:hypothetical protein
VIPNNAPAHAIFTKSGYAWSWPIVAWNEDGTAVVGRYSGATSIEDAIRSENIDLVGVEYGSWTATDLDVSKKALGYHGFTQEQVEEVHKTDPSIAKDESLKRLLWALCKAYGDGIEDDGALNEG